jgi:hypothetical protein
VDTVFLTRAAVLESDALCLQAIFWAVMLDRLGKHVLFILISRVCSVKPSALSKRKVVTELGLSSQIVSSFFPAGLSFRCGLSFRVLDLGAGGQQLLGGDEVG